MVTVISAAYSDSRYRENVLWISRNLQQSVWGGPSRWEAEQLRRPVPSLFRGILSAYPKRDVLAGSDAAIDHGQTGKVGKGSRSGRHAA